MAGQSFTKRNVGDIVYEAVDANLEGSRLVIPSTTATKSKNQGIKVATDAAVNVLGVSARFAITEANRAAAEDGGTTLDGFPILNTGVNESVVTVYNDCFGKLEYTAVAVPYGTAICAAAAGKVRAWVSGTDPASAIVGWCAQPGGVSSAGGWALARINR